MTELKDRIAALSPEKRRVLETRLAEMAAARGPAPDDRITPRDRTRPTPLGFAQQREWAVGRFRSANNVTGALRLEGRLDLPLLSRVLTGVLDRNEVLRSTVEITQDGIPVQVVQPTTAVPTPLVDLSSLSDEQQREEMRRHCVAGVLRPFDPGDPQRLRVTLLALAEDVHVALFATDHAASDAWSLSAIAQEIAALFASNGDGDGRRLPRPEIQFGDFASWQRARFSEEKIASELRHWRQTLAGLPASSAFPTDRPYPPRPAFSGNAWSTQLPAELSAALGRFGEREGASLFAIMLAACSVLLHRQLGQDDLVLGSLVSGRTRVETERLIGCFANPLPLRMRLRDGQTLREVVRAARDTFTVALDHQDVPFDRLINELGLGHEASQTSLSRMWINVLTVPDMSLELPSLHITPEPADLGMASVDLTLNVTPQAGQLGLQWQYMTELFDHDTVKLLAEQFGGVLRQLVTAPDTPVGQVEFAVPPVSVRHPHATAPTAAGAGFVELFQRRVALAPYAPAVVHDGVSTSYAELNRDANRLARQLKANGVGKDTAVGILVERSPRLAVAILGVLKAGGAYVAVDPGYPPDRVAFMLADAAARVLVTEQQLAATLADRGAVIPERTVLLDGASQLTDDGAEDLPEPPHPSALAYVVYTSGSTGRPKGTMIEHRSLVTFARDVADRLGLGAGDRFLQFASPSFDVLAEELFPTWLAGGAVVIPKQHIISGQVDLAELAERERLTVIELPTAYWHEWTRDLDRLDRDLPSCLRLVIIGGERVLPERLALWRRLGVPLMHVYGLTETTVSSTFFRLDPADPVYEWPNLPIGAPLPSADLRVVDRWLRPVPVGGVGELYIGGISLARGYLGQPALTAHRFIADPDPSRPGQRLYRTGDLVRRRADGNLEFVSRVDAQIKIRGFRVEPTEISSALNGHPQVAESVVAPYEPAPGDRRLVAYVVSYPGSALDVGELRRFLGLKLPAYMVPSSFVELDALPLSPNGKIDYGRLPGPDTSRPGPAGPGPQPQSPVQQKLADIIAAVVGVSAVSIEDNFFEIGGDSILAIQVVARAQEAGMQLSPYDLFARPTVAALAEVAIGGVAVDADQGEVTGPVPLAPTQSRFCQAGRQDPGHQNISVLLELGGAVEPPLLRTAVEHLLLHHDGLRQRFLLNGSRTRVRIAPSGDPTPFEVHDLSGLEPAEQDRRLQDLMAAVQSSLDLAVGPLIKIALVKFGAGRRDHVAVVAHRLAVDFVSMQIILEDLETVVVQLSAGEEVRFLPKTTSWQSWSRRLARYARSAPLQSERDYWSGLAATPAGELPRDVESEATANTVATARTVIVSLDSAETARLQHAVSGVLDCRVEEILLAALSRTLSEWGGAAQHLIALERQDRDQLFDDVDLTRTVGRFSRIHPVVLTWAPGRSPTSTLAAVQEVLRSVPAGGTGWQLLRHDADPVPDVPAELSFGYLGQWAGPASGTFAVVAEAAGDDESPAERRPYAIEVLAGIRGDELGMSWRYSERVHHRETIERLAGRYLDELRALIDRGRHADDSGHAQPDFPLAHVDQAQLDDLLGRLEGRQVAG